MRIDNSRKKFERIIIFTRYPEPGKTKTRLIPALGAEEAARLQQLMTEHVLDQVRQLRSTSAVEIEVRYEGGDKALLRRWLGPDLITRKQGPGDLGEKMLRSAREAYRSGVHRVLLIGSDCPDITPIILRRALIALEENDLVLGPASDGGYYLIGFKRSIPQLFKGIPWGTDRVLDETMNVSKKLGLVVAELDVLDDVDRPEDLEKRRLS